ncbi:hypothetical protein ACF1BQ_009630 [Bradyrhizobium sp. RDT10]
MMQAAPREQIASAYSTNCSTMKLNSPVPVVLVVNRDAPTRPRAARKTIDKIVEDSQLVRGVDKFTAAGRRLLWASYKDVSGDDQEG